MLTVPGLQKTSRKPELNSSDCRIRPQRHHDASLNHLLGFTLPPRQRPALGPRRSGKRSAHVANKDRFVHAQYRFLLKPTGDYTAHFADPDIHFHWPDVLQIIVPISSTLPTSQHQPSILELVVQSSASSKPLCPICLSEPAAPRMTRCGHIFCYPCLLHYLEVSEQHKGQGRNCPVCADTVLHKDVKSVRWFDAAKEAYQHHNKGQSGIAGQDTRPTMTFRLITRPDFTTLALPRSSTWPSIAVSPLQTPWNFSPDAATFSKFILASPDYMAEALKQDLLELEQEGKLLGQHSCGNELGVVFVKAAEKKVHDQLEKCNTLKIHSVMTARKQSLKAITRVQEQMQQADLAEQVRREKEASTSTSATDEDIDAENAAVQAYISTNSMRFGSRLQTHSPTTKLRRNVNPPIADATYYFYQSASGQLVYLHSLDIRILRSHFGSYEKFPNTITLPIEAFEDVTMTEELRRSHKYLSHLPMGCEVVFVETDVEAFVGGGCQGIEPALKQALKQRRNRRSAKVRREDKAKAKSEHRQQSELEQQTGQYRPHHPSRTNFLNQQEQETLEHDTSSSQVASQAPSHVTFASTLRQSHNNNKSTLTPTSTLAKTRTTMTTTHSFQDDHYDNAWAEFEKGAAAQNHEKTRPLLSSCLISQPQPQPPPTLLLHPPTQQQQFCQDDMTIASSSSFSATTAASPQRQFITKPASSVSSDVTYTLEVTDTDTLKKGQVGEARAVGSVGEQVKQGKVIKKNKRKLVFSLTAGGRPTS